MKNKKYPCEIFYFSFNNETKAYSQKKVKYIKSFQLNPFKFKENIIIKPKKDKQKPTDR
jgi:hypothetical protein